MRCVTSGNAKVHFLRVLILDRYTGKLRVAKSRRPLRQLSVPFSMLIWSFLSECRPINSGGSARSPPYASTSCATPLLSRNFSGIGSLASTGVKSCSTATLRGDARHHRAGVQGRGHTAVPRANAIP